MIEKKLIEYLTVLYEDIFRESVAESKEFLTFVQEGNPHPLRIKVEDYINKALIQGDYFLDEVKDVNIKAFELDALITNYIEDNHV